MVKPRRGHPTATSRCIQSWRTIYGGGATRHPTRRIRILSFLPSRRMVACLFPLPYLLLTISGRPREQPDEVWRGQCFRVRRRSGTMLRVGPAIRSRRMSVLRVAFAFGRFSWYSFAAVFVVSAVPLKQATQILCFGVCGSAQQRLDVEDFLQRFQGG